MKSCILIFILIMLEKVFKDEKDMLVFFACKYDLSNCNFQLLWHTLPPNEYNEQMSSLGQFSSLHACDHHIQIYPG